MNSEKERIADILTLQTDPFFTDVWGVKGHEVNIYFLLWVSKCRQLGLYLTLALSPEFQKSAEPFQFPLSAGKCLQKCMLSSDKDNKESISSTPFFVPSYITCLSNKIQHGEVMTALREQVSEQEAIPLEQLCCSRTWASSSPWLCLCRAVSSQRGGLKSSLLCAVQSRPSNSICSFFTGCLSIALSLG